MTTHTGAASDEADPIVARYNVFLKPQLPEHQKLLVLQYPNKVDKNGAASGSGGGSLQTPTELRIKTGSGMVEVDVPIDYTTAYDRTKGVAWGTALATSTKAKAGGSHGLASGFGVGGQQGNNRNGGGRGGGGGGGSAAAANTIIEDDGGAGRAITSSTDWADAVRQDRVLRMQTLGGMCPPARIAEAKWMIGVFDGGNVHLTPVSSMVHLRPQLHHIDAETEVERAKHRDTGPGAGGDGAGGAGAGAGGAAAGGPRGQAGPRAIHMTVKSAGADGEEIITETMADRLRGVQMENWSRMVYVGDDDEHSWDVYDQTLFLKDPAPDPAAAEGDDADKSKGAVEGGGAASLRAKVPALRTTWTEDDMLVAISKIEKPAEDDLPIKLEAKPAAGKGKGKVTFAEPATAGGTSSANGTAGSAGVEVKTEATGQAAQTRMRPLARPAASLAAAGAAPSTTRGRGARTRQASTKSSAMDIDP
ncbi:dna-directed rna polymerase iii complex subunit rpc37 [Ophiostoma piceae UAMH 11346]|uniref:Dna-directed rna polymerase iii complex subunit rpc37 n=1 Tax=Ophiostoma piceae (strain UAMH 11346) TaxID=1262450 RepID=S3C2K2_OPHP1|nr:dna-directed rna polymerase iii complex subunit rpc37 [Ophiostoma piceae UAMH 11346]